MILLFIWISMRPSGVGARRCIGRRWIRGNVHSLNILLDGVMTSAWRRRRGDISLWRRRWQRWRARYLVGTLVDSRRSMWLTTWLFSGSPSSLRFLSRLSSARLWILIGSLGSSSILRLQAVQCRGTSNSCRCESRLNATTRLFSRWDYGSLRRRRRAPLSLRGRG